GRVAVVTFLVAVEDAVPDHLARAAGGAAVAVGGVAVVALLARVEHAVAAARCGHGNRRRRDGARSRGEGRAGAADEERPAGRRAGDVPVADLPGVDDVVAAASRRRERRGGRRRGGALRAGAGGQRDEAAPQPDVGGGEAARDVDAAAEAHRG